MSNPRICATLVSLMFAGVCGAQAPGSYDGAWTVKWKTQRGLDREAQLDLKDGAGTWRLLALGRGGEMDPCDKGSHPVVVEKATPEALAMNVQRSKTLAGCRDSTLAISKAPDGTLQGQFGGGTQVQMVKR